MFWALLALGPFSASLVYASAFLVFALCVHGCLSMLILRVMRVWASSLCSCCGKKCTLSVLRLFFFRFVSCPAHAASPPSPPPVDEKQKGAPFDKAYVLLFFVCVYVCGLARARVCVCVCCVCLRTCVYVCRLQKHVFPEELCARKVSFNAKYSSLY